LLLGTGNFTLHRQESAISGTPHLRRHFHDALHTSAAVNEQFIHLANVRGQPE
jgi:hypothetical protein